jgi:hypothetical protein
MRLWPVTLLILCTSSLCAQEPAKSASGSLTIEDVVSLSKAGISEEVIVTKVKVNAKPFDLNADEIVELKKDGVSETVIKYLTNPALPYSPPAPSAPPAPPPPAAPPAAAASAPSASPPPPPPPPKPKPLSDPLALKVPLEPGIYYYLAQPDRFTPLPLKTVVPYKQPGKAAALSAGLVNGHIIGSVVGPKAEIRVAGNSSVFYVRLPDKASIDDFTLLALDKSGNRRDLDFGTKLGKPVFQVSSIKEVVSKEVYTGVYRVTVPMIKKGEYLFFILGSGDEKKGLLGKGYDLGVN